MGSGFCAPCATDPGDGFDGVELQHIGEVASQAVGHVAPRPIEAIKNEVMDPKPEREPCPVARPRAEYVLTAKGRELGPALRALKSWGQKHT
jgi:hypothetical protein